MGGGGGTTTPKQGIKAQLFYKTATMPIFSSVKDYVTKAKLSNQNLFFTDMFVPTRLFSTGFKTQTGSVLNDDAGNLLIENFGLQMDTVIRLGANDAEGTYEFTLLSDDGSTMTLNNNGNISTIISNDGDHPTRMGCSTTKIDMTKDTKLNAEVLYYQGPRYHIANVLMWRKLNTSQNAGQDSACGMTGNYTFFDPDHNSAPTATYNALLNRGWKPVAAENFYLPDEVDQSSQFNPCTAGTAPTISDFRISELVSTDVWVSWTTDIPATDQLLIIRVSDGTTVLTQTDNVLRTTHTVHYSGLTSGTAYQVQAVDVSEDLGKAVSDPVSFTTP
jgi:hypothetical protein